MRTSLLLVPMFVLAACGGGSGNDRPSTNDTLPTADTGASVPLADNDRPGYYEDTLPCADCPGIVTQLWVRSDSTFILRQHYIGRDKLPFGTIGQWHVVNGLVTVGMTGDKPDFYRPTAEGLMLVDELGEAAPTGLDLTLDRLADEIQDEVPRMRLTGTFTYLADTKSFQPCGSRFSWPCAGGEDLGSEEGEVVGSMNGVDLERQYLAAVKTGGKPWTIEVECSLAMGPAMEGDGADEYLLIHRVINAQAQCPVE
jgi:copper homeostasis protein (lipoprotein)